MNSKNINKDTDQSPPEGRHSLRRATDDLGAQSFPLKPQYAILVEAGWPGSGYHVVERPAPMPAVGLKPRRVETERSEKTFSVQGADEELVQQFKDWCNNRPGGRVTIKSAFEVAIREFLILHS